MFLTSVAEFLLTDAKHRTPKDEAQFARRAMVLAEALRTMEDTPSGKNLNPGSMVMSQMEGHWQRIAILLLWKLNKGNVARITVEDIKSLNRKFAPNAPILFTHGTVDAMEFSLVTEGRAKVLAEHDKTQQGSA